MAAEQMERSGQHAMEMHWTRAYDLLSMARMVCPPQRDYIEQLELAPPPASAFFLLARCVECALRAFLIGRDGAAIRIEERFPGRDLEPLLEEARRRNIGRAGSSFSREDAALVLELNEGYQQGAGGFMGSPSELPSYPEMFRLVERIVRGLEGFVAAYH